MRARSIRLSCLCACTVAFSGCRGKERAENAPPATTASATAAPTAAPETPVPAVLCRVQDDPKAPIARRDLDDLTGAAQRIANMLRGETGLPLWNLLDPQVRDASRRERFLANLDTVAARVRRAGSATVERVLLLEVAPGIQGPMKVTCPVPGGAWTVATRVDGADLALAYLAFDGDPLPPRLVVRLRRGAKGWNLLGIESSAHRYRGVDAPAYLARAEAAHTAGRPVEAYLDAGIAQVLSMRGRGVKTPLSGRVAQFLAKGRATAAERAVAKALDLPSDRIVSVGLFNTEFDLAPRIRYVTKVGDLRDEPRLRKESARLADALVQRIPALAQTFDTVVFEAVETPPATPGAPVDVARMAVRIAERPPAHPPAPAPGG